MMAASSSFAPLSPLWRYRHGGAAGIVEVGLVEGCDVGLPAHFHDEDQLTFVVVGRRRFRLGGTAVTLAAGQGVLVPAGVPHLSLPEPDGVSALNLYLPAGTCRAAVVAAAEHHWRAAGRLDAATLAALFGAFRQPAVAPGARRDSVTGGIGRAAAHLGMSREGFSRAFLRRHGMPPHAFGRILRLNAARDLLRRGARPAIAAAETGFSDQSHLGRCFRRTFGVTPGLYRAGWSQTYQTEG